MAFERTKNSDQTKVVDHTSHIDNTDRRLATLRRNNEESNAFVRACIESALIQLMESKPFSSITVTDIARRAGVSRNAYYRNYDSKEAILFEYLNGLITTIDVTMTKYDPLTQTREAWIALLGEVRGIAPQYRLLLEVGYGERIVDAMQRNMNRGPASAEAGPRYASRYWAGAICAVLEQWVKDGMTVPESELADIMTALMHRGVATVTEFGTGCEAPSPSPSQ
ncbi:TetR/AcrR family transcriptional regulator [Bifidobacterium tissieri]|uniref:TetR/AcrR family transcriptional regulator n=1 Tax=Bifidobacterium tissieri TaxID=1630162 RepID=A0A5M9ZM93_9BIFI|nr:TetR/AcrR family transcriptional regulator [Bifidobacterium tissieri]KAA8827032.1 TetR/AcrR family transcriptional regulator [Bifidobacterium tissieri]KAA8828767.1 TetR/AcrR family transcriptional regulator [Bifidobacterium tissieri]